MTLYLTGQIPSGKNQVLMTRDGRKYPNARFKAWREEAARQLRGQRLRRTPYQHRLKIEVSYTPGDKRKRDVSGILDALFHLLERVGLVKDDSQFCDVQFWTMPVNPKLPGIWMTLAPHKEEF